MIGTQSCEAKSYLYVAGVAALNAVWICALFAAVNFILEWRTLKVLPRKALAFIKRKFGK